MYSLRMKVPSDKNSMNAVDGRLKLEIVNLEECMTVTVPVFMNWASLVTYGRP
jgi:hypothetical protein